MKKVLKIILKDILILLLFIVLFLSQVINFGTTWAETNYSFSSFDEILYTLGTSVTTASNDALKDFFNTSVFPPLIISFICLSLFIIFYIVYKKYLKDSQTIIKIKLLKKQFSLKINIFYLVTFIFVLAIMLFLIKSILYAVDTLYIDEYIKSNMQTSTFFEDNYVNPNDVLLTFPNEKRNLIYIFLESMESTYIDKESGGAYDINYIPNLTNLALDYTNFSSNELVGGAYMMNGTTWTMGGMIAQTAGIPIKNVYGANDERSYENGLVNGAVSIGDILEEEGYRQYIMVGSDLTFGGRRAYFKGHGNYTVYDYYTAIDEGFIDEDYYVFWGLEDEKLFAWAKEKLTEIADGDEPFNFMMLTVDTHASDGYTSDFCPDYSSDAYLNSIYCSDMQVGEFVEWIMEQDFYENTTIVLAGDHVSMNNYSFDNIDEDYSRSVYNVFINSLVDTSNNKNREFTTFDLYPTTLAALGVSIEGERLGLGTNLFSDKETLSEKYGNYYINEELKKFSTYYELCINLGQCK